MKKWIAEMRNIVEEAGWGVVIYGEDEFLFQNSSPAGQDFTIHITAESEAELKKKLYEQYKNYDPSEEAYLWLDNSGHGKNGAPYKMVDVYNDMVACADMILELYNTL